MANEPQSKTTRQTARFAAKEPPIDARHAERRFYLPMAKKRKIPLKKERNLGFCGLGLLKKMFFYYIMLVITKMCAYAQHS